MRKSNWSVAFLFLVTLAAGAVVGSALRAGMQSAVSLQAGEPYWMANNGSR